MSFLYYDSVFSTTTEVTQRQENGEDEGIYGEYEDEGTDTENEDILRLDFFRFTTRKRYIWEDWTVPTRDPDYGESSSSTNVLLYIILPILVSGIGGTLLYFCFKNWSENDCCSDESDSHSSISADRFTTVQRPPIGRNQYTDSRREPEMRDLFSELDNIGGAAHLTDPTISLVNSIYANSTQDRREAENVVAEKPPDYSTVTLNDLVNPTKPAFPVVKKDSETPPPEYGKGNVFL
ncbi:unnamed protein product [Larinioides sclopetarius]|uniref:Uncharacterized protein n=1 Tax=Larinioides sclopetarius TaxID=280406 RepID=A0AAV2BM14_9ARAC